MSNSAATVVRTDVTEKNFDAFVESRSMVVLLVHEAGCPAPHDLRQLAEVCARNEIPAELAAVTGRQSPDLLALFGIEGAPYLMVFRERIALYAECVMPSTEGLRQLLAQAASLDMGAVRDELEAARRARDALVTRRACPTLRQQRHSD